MNHTVDRRLRDHLARIEGTAAAGTLRNLRRGIEKESLRVDQDGLLAQTPHPPALGSALTHPYITTDYSEALLEFVTPVGTRIDDTIDCLEKIHEFVHQHLGDERLWVTSMPCIVTDENTIPIARYGTSNVGMMKHIYRRGLGYRYGKLMQCIAGIHYNFSLPDIFWDHWLPWGTRKEQRQSLISAQYFGAVRNFHRSCWMLFYLFGASPAVCRSFVAGRDHHLEPYDAVTLYGPHATSLRMSDLGYHNPAQSEISIDFNSLPAYVASLRRATRTSYPDYERIGIKVDGEYRQLNTSLLQIENEYYAVIRPKRVTASGERPTRALASRGVEYIEVRCLDLDPFEYVGISADTIRFLDLFLLWCLFEPSPPITAGESDVIAENKRRVALRGRDPDLRLARITGETTFREVARDILNSLGPFATLLDNIDGSSRYAAAIDFTRECVERPDKTPSARVLAEMSADHESFVEFASRKSREHREHFRARVSRTGGSGRFTELARESHERQQALEAGDTIDLDTYLERYFAQG